MTRKSQIQLYKEAIFAQLDNHIRRNTPLQISWECHYCDENHSMNLLEHITRVEMDYNASIAQPQLALLDEKENIVTAIDITAKKLTTNEAALIYKENYIIYIQVLAGKDTAPGTIAEKLSAPPYVSLCFNPACPQCGDHMHKKQIIVATTDCWSCNAPMQFAYWSAGGHKGTPADFNTKDIELAAGKGVRFSIQHSPIQNEYNANTCNACRKFIGDFFVHDHYGSVPSETYNAGYLCLRCGGGIVFDEDDS